MESTVDKLTERFKALTPSPRSPALNAEGTRDHLRNSDLHGWKTRLRKRQVIAQSVVADEKPQSKKPRIIVTRREPKMKRKAIYIPTKRGSQKRKIGGNNSEKVKSQPGVNVRKNLPDPRGKAARLAPNFNIAFDDDEDDDDLDFVSTLPSDEELDDEKIRIEAVKNGKKTENRAKSSTRAAGGGSPNRYPYGSLPSDTSPTPSPDRFVIRKFLRKPANAVPRKSGKRGMYKSLWKVRQVSGGDSMPDGPK